MAGHDEDVLYTGMLHVRAWGKQRFMDTFRQASESVLRCEIPLIPGVTYESDPGGGGPGRIPRQRKYDLIADGTYLPGEPDYQTPDD